MPSPRARPKEAEMDPSAPGPSPWTPAARVSDVPAVTRPASARCAPLCCGDADQGAAPQHHQQPVFQILEEKEEPNKAITRKFISRSFMAIKLSKKHEQIKLSSIVLYPHVHPLQGGSS
ncbi:zinc finger protein 16 [Phyllostomus discolor]|uniref:Zinc finger protein 16 n=1 Tax=Phyllostomus discolor TaxID=89673 RepID=A0A833ZSC9_9CHIR|nr:zinc finger protein 16 [Phyllostomus discolor]